MADIQIPELYLPGFISLAKLSLVEIKEIVGFVSSVPVGTGGNTFQQMFNQTFVNHADSVLAQTIYSLGSFNATELKDLDKEQLASQIVRAYIEDAGDEKSENLQQNITLILGALGNINSTYKASSLLAENNSNYLSSHIVSDIRLVFNDEIHNTNRNAIVIHHLKINVEENNQRKEYYFSLESSDLLKLKEQIERAEQKDKLIREQYNKVISFIDITD